MRTARRMPVTTPATKLQPARPRASASRRAHGASRERGGMAERKYEVLFDYASDAVLVIRPDGTIDAANQAVEELTGYLKSEIVGATIATLAPRPIDGVAGQGPARPITQALFAAPGTYEDVAIARKDGYVRFVDLSVRIVEGPRGPLALGLLRDFTEKRRMERELITKHSELRNAYTQLEKNNAELSAMQATLVQSGKMAALGELAAGIAHELNQPLQGIRGWAQELESDPKLATREIIASVDKMSAIIQHLRTFVRKSEEKHEDVDVHHAVEEALKMLSRQFASRGIEVERDFAKDLPTIFGNAIQLEQVFINLASNARDAIEATGRGSGKIRISTRAISVDGRDFVEVRFRDDGAGMAAQTRSKVFNPFFTTKEVGKGMGLGLSLSYGILNRIHGSIIVESELGKGAEFIIRLPRDFRQLA